MLQLAVNFRLFLYTVFDVQQNCDDCSHRDCEEKHPPKRFVVCVKNSTEDKCHHKMPNEVDKKFHNVFIFFNRLTFIGFFLYYKDTAFSLICKTFFTFF